MASDPIRIQLVEWVEHNRTHILAYLTEAEGQRNHLATQCHRAQLDIINRLERQLLLDDPVGAKWKIP